MQNQLTSFIEILKVDRRIISFDEAATQQAVVTRLLSLLGWDIFNIDEVTPEYSIGEGRVDYSLRIGNVNKVFIEVKKIGEELEKHQEQLLEYSYKQGVRLSILTNGVTWWFYLPWQEGSWEQRKFYSIDILQQESNDGAEFKKILSLKGRKRPYFSSNKDELWEPRKINNTDIFAETNLSANSIVKICFDTLAVFGYSTNDLKIEAH